MPAEGTTHDPEQGDELPLSAAEQEYLESLFWLYEAGFQMTGANLARAMQLTPPTVHEMFRRVEREGWGGARSGRSIQLPPGGAEQPFDRVRRRGARARGEPRGPPPDDRTVPHRRRGRPMGRRARGGREARVRDDPPLRVVRAHVGGGRHDLPARPSDQGARADGGRAARRLRRRREGDRPAPGERGRGSAALPQGPGRR